MHNLLHRTVNLLRKPRLLRDGWTYGRKQILTINGVRIYWDGTFIDYISGMTIDADGCPRTYNESNTGLDDLRNAKDHRGNWVGIVAFNNVPVKQSSSDPYPGYYVSTTSYQRKRFGRIDPDRYVDSEKVPYVALSPLIIRSVAAVFLGCECMVSNEMNGRVTAAVAADVGPKYKAGEASMACAKNLGINSNPRVGGTSNKIIKYLIKPGSPATINGERFELQRL